MLHVHNMFPSLAVYKNEDLKFVVVQQRAPLVKVITSYY